MGEDSQGFVIMWVASARGRVPERSWRVKKASQDVNPWLCEEGSQMKVSEKDRPELDCLRIAFRACGPSHPSAVESTLVEAGEERYTAQVLSIRLIAALTFSFRKKALPLGVAIGAFRMILKGKPTRPVMQRDRSHSGAVVMMWFITSSMCR